MKNTFKTIYDITRRIPYGMVTTYGQIARLTGNPRHSRVVGYAMSGCKLDNVPCHRVVSRFGDMSDAFSPLGKQTQRLLLEMEGVEFLPDGRIDLERYMWYGDEQL